MLYLAHKPCNKLMLPTGKTFGTLSYGQEESRNPQILLHRCPLALSPDLCVARLVNSPGFDGLLQKRCAARGPLCLCEHRVWPSVRQFFCKTPRSPQYWLNCSSPRPSVGGKKHMCRRIRLQLCLLLTRPTANSYFFCCGTYFEHNSV